MTVAVEVRLRAVRKARGWSLAAVAAKLGVSGSTVSRLERGLIPLTVPMLVELADVLGVEWQSLVVCTRH